MNSSPPLEQDAAIALGIASTALPFARTSRAASECWLRILRLHGDAGVALQSLGVGEAVIRATSSPEPHAVPAGEDVSNIAFVLAEAGRIAFERGAEVVATSDLLLAVMDACGADFDEALQAHGTDREEVLERLFAQLAS
jgi:hypothetical protein